MNHQDKFKPRESFESAVDAILKQHQGVFDALRLYERGHTYKQLLAEVEHAMDGYQALLEKRDARIVELDRWCELAYALICTLLEGIEKHIPDLQGEARSAAERIIKTYREISGEGSDDA